MQDKQNHLFHYLTPPCESDSKLALNLLAMSSIPVLIRAFPVGGDSRPPHNDLSFVVGKYVENLGEIKKDKTYILITLSEGITYKRLSSKMPIL